MACTHHLTTAKTATYRTALWAALAINGVMFFAEMIGAFQAGAVSLLADSLDFLGYTANYAISLFVFNTALRTRAKASIIKGGSMLLFGIFVLGSTLYHWWFIGKLPDYHEMSLIGVLALLANLSVVWILSYFRGGDSNMRSVWLCSRNDALGNLTVIFAGIAVYFTQSAYPDFIVALIMAYLALSAGWQIVRQAKRELTDEPVVQRCHHC